MQISWLSHFCDVFLREGDQHAIAIAVTKVAHTNIQLQSKQQVHYPGEKHKTHITTSQDQL